MPLSTVVDLLAILTAGLIAALLCRRLGISAIVGYLVIGGLLGKSALGLIGGESHDIAVLAEAGVFLLLFSIGLEFSLEDLLRLGRHLLVGGSAQMLLVIAPVAAWLTSWGLEPSDSIVLGAAVAFSSTVLVFKSLVEFGEAATPHGRRAIGVLLFQDLSLVPLLLFIPTLTDGVVPSASELLQMVAASLLYLALIVACRYLLRSRFIPRIADYRSPDLVILFTLVALGGITLSAYLLGLPAAVGAFAAGLAFGGNRWSGQIDALLLPFRETCAAVFFVSLGLLLEPAVILAHPGQLLLLTLLLIVVKILAGGIALRLTGLSWRSSLAMGLGLAHVGEFAFVLAKVAWEAGVIPESEYQQLVALSLATLILTPLLLQLGLKFVEAGPEEDLHLSVSGIRPETLAEAIVIGIGPIGKQIASYLETQGIEVSLVDRSPINLYPFEQLGFHTVAGDATQPEILRAAHLSRAQLVVLCVPDDQIALEILAKIRRDFPRIKVVVRCRYQSNVAAFRRAKVQYVVSEEQQAYESLVGYLTSEFAGSRL